MDFGSLPPQLRPVLQALGKTMAARQQAVRRQVAELQTANPGRDREQLARILIEDTRRRVVRSAVATSAPAIVPGVGSMLSLSAAAGQSLYALEQEVELVMAIAMLYGHELESSEDRLLEALLVVGLAGGGVKVRDAVVVAGGHRITVAAFRRLPRAWMARAGSRVLTRILARVFRSRAAAAAARATPLAVGAAAGAGFDWIAVTGLGRAAIRYYGTHVRRQERLSPASHGQGQLPPAGQSDGTS
jgi:hypothetical protein